MTEPLSLAGVELRRHTDSDYPIAGTAFKPYAHQQELRQLFHTEESFLAVNDSPTGGGKTMSWLAPILERGEHALALYPTNALIHDQEQSLRTEISEKCPDTELGVDTKLLTVTADTLRGEHAERFPTATSNGARLRQLLTEEIYHGDSQVILLTNPDIFVMMRRSLYGRPGNPGARVRALNEFQTVVVDEFHRAGRKEQNTLLFLLDEMYDLPSYRCALSQIVLLSATPTDWLEDRFENGMQAPYYRVAARRATVEQRPFTDTVSSDWGAVMPPVELDVRSASTFGTADELLDEDWEDTREFASRPGKTVFILDGIREVEDVYTRLADALDEQEVVRIDGFHRGDLEAKLDRFDVLVSNSAVEVGIDFTVDRLVFSAHDRASFLQRLGRLRTETVRQPARCYVPSTVAATLDERTTADSIARERLTRILGDAYHDPRDRESFDWRYSAAEAYHHLRRRTRDANPELAEQIRTDGWNRITAHFASKSDFTREDLERYIDPIENAVEDTLKWYRGDSLQVLVYDPNSEGRETVRAYNLFYLLRHGDIEFHSREAFERVVPERHHATISNTAPYVTGFCTYRGTIPPNEDGYGREVALKATSEIYRWLNTETDRTGRTPRTVDDLSVQVTVDDGSRRIGASIEQLREEMVDLDILAYVVDDAPRAVKNQYDLGPFFFLYGLVTDDGLCSIALGTDALYLHCAIQDEAESVDLERFGVDI
ncbi:type I-D CRISPR-associated helicase Cas3' [Haloarcula sp. Atlit-47R]|uniref:type I-D CRISPR-associated helicase Cas3' n=1 Tax=Haloarcula sp. Atlit-47R TaxID=2282132 RepID=UPI000EF236F0|nr:type I-D CRISPR-associated helicase Cas3' [Haloarcula sp. Atlit-47R]RLM41478.1 type I-D CRISPR-associated helicase Cas3' [Haloarcula sp. Atlit-47R]